MDALTTAERSHIERLIASFDRGRTNAAGLWAKVFNVPPECERPNRKGYSYFAVSRGKDFLDASAPYWYFFWSTAPLDRAKKLLALEGNDATEERLAALKYLDEKVDETEQSWQKFILDAAQAAKILDSRRIGYRGFSKFENDPARRWCISFVEWSLSLPEGDIRRVEWKAARYPSGADQLVIDDLWGKSIEFCEWLLGEAAPSAIEKAKASYVGEGRILIADEQPAVKLKDPHIPFMERLLKGYGVASTKELEKVASNPARTYQEISEGYGGRLAPFVNRPAEKDTGYTTTIKDCRQVVSKS